MDGGSTKGQCQEQPLWGSDQEDLNGLKRMLIENPDAVTMTSTHHGVREVGLLSQLCVCVCVRACMRHDGKEKESVKRQESLQDRGSATL